MRWGVVTFPGSLDDRDAVFRVARRALLLTTAAGLTIGICAVAQAADTRQDAKIDIAAGGSLNIVNGCGSVTLHSGAGHQVPRVQRARVVQRVDLDRAAPVIARPYDGAAGHLRADR